MSQSYLTSYQPLNGNRDIEARDDDEDLSPDMHTNMLIHVVPESGKTRWNHIEDLDSFFSRVYQYHQQNGLLCMMLNHVLSLFQFIFVIVFTTFLFTSVNYDVLFGNTPGGKDKSKITMGDVILSLNEALSNFTWKMIIVIIVAFIFWVLRLGHTIINYFHFCEIKKFFNIALGIHDRDLGNVTWDEVQHRVMEVQVEQRMCIHKTALTELDIYHRILRFNNYFIAMVNKSIIPLTIKVPFYGDVIFLTQGLSYNIEFLLFWGPWAPFINNWHLREEYKRSENRHQLAEELGRKIFYIGIINFILFPFILLWQILYSFFHYTELVKRQPSFLGSRRWSHYGEIYLRHFNELDHELHARLNRGYRAASQYMNIFTSPLLAIVSRHVAFIFGAIFGVLAFLTIYDEDVLQVEHVLTLMTMLAFGVGCCKAFIPEDNIVWCPELLMTRVLSEVHYLPDSWKGKAHTSFVRKEFSQLFQYKLVHIIEELLSPIITPAILCFRMRYKALDIVDFFRNFTVEVTGVGDICSFAQMDVRRHGSKTWQPECSVLTEHIDTVQDDLAMRTDGGKTELSLLHFTLTNPKWKPPQDSNTFLNAVKMQVQKDFTALVTLSEENALYNSMNSLSLGGGLGTIGTSVLRSPWMGAANALPVAESMCGGVNHFEGSRHGSNNGILGSISQANANSISGSVGDPSAASTRGQIYNNLLHSSPTRPQDFTAVDMGVSTLYLYELHQRRRGSTTYTDTPLVGGSSLYNPTSFLLGGDSHYNPTNPLIGGGSYYHSTDPPSERSFYPSAHVPLLEDSPLNEDGIEPSSLLEDLPSLSRFQNNRPPFRDT